MGVETKQKRTKNIHPAERFLSVILGGGLAAFALARRKPLAMGLGLPAAAFLLERGITGWCSLYEVAGVSTNRGPYSTDDGLGVRVHRAVTIQRPVDEVYRFWRQLENLPLFMHHLESVRQLDNKRSEWGVKAPIRVSWQAEIVEERPNELISYRSLPGSQIETEGVVRFKDAPQGKGAEVHVELSYKPVGGPLLQSGAKLMRTITEKEIKMDMLRLKALLEAGEIPSTYGQPSGRRREHERVDEVRQQRGLSRDKVQEASEQSFPASDPPAWITRSA